MPYHADVPDRDLQHAAASINRLRELRVRPAPDRCAARTIDTVRDDLRKRVQATGGIIEAWRTVVPDNLRDRAFLQTFQRGVLMIDTPDASTRYLLQRWLRGGGQRMLAGCSPATIKKIVVRIAAQAD